MFELATARTLQDLVELTDFRALLSGRGEQETGLLAAYTPDSIPADTSTTATIAIGDVVASSLETLGDRDWFRLDLSAYSSVHFYLQSTNHAPLNGLPGIQNPVLNLYDAQGNLIQSNIDNIVYQAYLDFATIEDGPYFIEVAGYNDLRIGDYELTVTGGTDAVVDTIAVGDVVTGHIDSYGGTEFYQIDLTAGDRIYIFLNGRDLDPNDTVYAFSSPLLRIFDPNGNVITELSNQPWTDALPFYLNLPPATFLNPAQSGTYHIEVDSTYAYATGEFVLRVRDDARARLKHGDSDVFRFLDGPQGKTRDGGAGQDAVDYSGIASTDVKVADLGDGRWTVTDLDTGLTDTLTGIEALIFSDTVLTA